MNQILAGIVAILEAAKGLLPGAAFAELLVKLIQTGIKAFEDHTGQPIDPALLKPIDPIP